MSCGIRLSGVSKVYTRPRRVGRPTLRAALRAIAPGVEEIRALDRVSLSIADGERVGIIGPNGAGKTTLLHLVAGLAAPTAGTVEVAGRVHAVMTLGSVLREEATGRENIMIDAEVQGRTRQEIADVIDRIVEFSELGEFIDLPVRTYSSGMKARLAFSMVAFIEPEILIVDEVLSVGDAGFSRKAGARMKELARAGRIVLVVSHGLASIVEMCSRCLWLEGGRLVMDGDPSAVTEAYAESVRVADEAALRRMFDEGPPLPPGRPGATLHRRSLVQEGAGGALLVARRDGELRIAGDASALARPDLRLRILRLDGALISETRLSESQDAVTLRGRFDFAIAMRPVVLGPGVYRAELALIDGDAVVAGRAHVFEVRTDDPLLGGVPTLLYPSRLKVRALSPAVGA
ncbi:MAG: ABC transporter ATP-binding protein [Rhodospirillaceae bacterium]|nr:ABC transporter ATP-binding protein [Rhodospirillaceae bacterium]